MTIQAAVELQVMCELERLDRTLTLDYVSSAEFLQAIATYKPSDRVEKTRLETYSTSKGADYGRTSPLVQFEVYRNAIRARQRLGLFHEVEWVQLARSNAMTRYAIEHPDLRLGSSGQLNITLLFGFSPRLPFPESYVEFKAVVDAAKSLEYDLGESVVRKRHVTITVGAAVMPQQAHEHFKELDVGLRRGTQVCALRRLAAYAAQPDSQVDILRVGMEDTPYEVDEQGNLHLADNLHLLSNVIEELEENGARVEFDHEVIFERMGMQAVKEKFLSVQRKHPLGETG